MEKSDNEKIEDIISEMRERCIDEKHSPSLWPYLDRIEAAHKREIAELTARLDMVVKEIDKQICHPSESNCKQCGDHRGNCQCGSLSNNEMMKLLKFAKGE